MAPHEWHELDKRLDRIILLQEQTTKNVDKLTKDIETNTCYKHECESLKERVSKLEKELESYEDLKSSHEKDSDKLKDLWFFVFIARNPKMGGLIAVGLYASAATGAWKFIF